MFSRELVRRGDPALDSRRPIQRQARPAKVIQRAPDGGRSLSPNDLLSLQSTIGNRAVCGLLDRSRGSAIQRKKKGGEALPQVLQAKMASRGVIQRAENDDDKGLKPKGSGEAEASPSPLAVDLTDEEKDELAADSAAPKDEEALDEKTLAAQMLDDAVSDKKPDDAPRNVGSGVSISPQFMTSKNGLFARSKRAISRGWKRSKRAVKTGWVSAKMAFLVAKQTLGYATGFSRIVDLLVSTLPFFSIAFAGVAAGLHLRALLSSSSQAHHLKTIKATQESAGNQSAAEFVGYARSQKTKKAVYRALMTAASVLLVCSAILAIVSNPIGWLIGLTGSALALSLILWRLGRSRFKKHSGMLGTYRKNYAKELYTALAVVTPPAPWALEVCKELHLDPYEMRNSGNARQRIEQKLKSF